MVKIFSADDSARTARRRSLALRAAAAGLAVAAGMVLLFAVAVAGSERLRAALLERSGANSARSALRAVALAPWRFARAAVDRSPVETLTLDVKFKHMHTIHERRDEALRSGLLATSDEDFVPAGIELAGRSVTAKIRLAGDRADLLAGEKWPLLLQTKGEGHVFGMRRLELLPPAARDFHSVGLFLDHLRSEAILSPRFSLVDLVLNGQHVGLMALEEAAAAEMLARQGRHDGPFLRFDSRPEDAAARRPTAIAPVDPQRLPHSRQATRALETATTLLSAYLEGDLAAAEVFDVELLARFLALVEAWGAREALEWRELRFYFDPLTARLEPVGRAASLAARARGGEPVVADSPFGARLLDDPEVAAAFDRALDRITGEMQEPEFSEALRERDLEALRALHREHPLWLPFDAEGLALRAARRQRETRSRAAAGGHERAIRSAHGAELPVPESSVEETLTRHPFLRWDEDAGELRSEPGRWEVAGSLILPRGAGLALSAGTVLRFQAREGLIARGPLTFLGSEDAPIVLEGPAGERASQLWSGVYVVESTRPSRWSHVVVRNTGGFERKGWELDSSVVFRKAAVEMEACRFSGNRSNDALKVVHSSFSLRDVAIEGPKGDGFDAEFSQGSIRGGFVVRAGGDGIDLGGSQVTVRGTRLSQIRDKAISVGEGSRLIAEAVEIDRVGIGVASKNGSTVEISDSTLREVADVGLVAYMNQPEYGPGSLVATGNRISGAALPALAQSGSRLVLDGSALRPVDAAIDRLYKD